MLRPLFWWVLLVLVLYGIRLHQRWNAETHLRFTASVDGQLPFAETTAELDGRPYFSGQQVNIGQHNLVVTQPNAYPFVTNLFVRYGPHDFGNIGLEHTKGTLVVSCSPPAEKLIIRGSIFSTTLTNTAGFNSRVPTDNYEIEVVFTHMRSTDTARVIAESTTTKTFAPQFGSVAVTGSHPDIRFELRDLNGQVMASGQMPMVITGLPEGDRYKLTAKRKDDEKSRAVAARFGTTNEVNVEFTYGSVTVVSKPAGASVYHAGDVVGITPLTINELSPGSFEFSLSRTNYDSVTAELFVVANQTNYFSTNLINENFTRSMALARQSFANENFGRSAEAVKEALKEIPGEATALALSKQIEAKINAQQASAAAQEAAELDRNQQAKRPGNAFSSLCEQTTNANLFSEFLIKTSLSAKLAKDAIIRSLQVSPLGFEIVSDTVADKETYAIVGRQTFSLGFLGGTERDCLIIVGKTTDSETEIYFKVLEYSVRTETDNGQSTKVLVPLHSSRIQMNGILQTTINQGIALVRERITKVIP